MIIALDYDGTFTEDPDLWIEYILDARSRNHRIVIVTLRYASENIPEEIVHSVGGGNVFYTGRKAKKPFMAVLGIHPNVWIDDHPQSVFLDAEQIWGISLPEGHTDSSNAIKNA